MIEIMPFGKHKGKSVEQIAVGDYDYFKYVFKNINIQKHSLKQRFEFVNHVVNNFLPQNKCNGQKDSIRCPNNALIMSIYHNSYMDVYNSSIGFTYCSPQCFNSDPNASPEKTTLYTIRFDTSLVGNRKADQKNLLKIIAECMGLKERGKTTEYLEDFFNHCQLKTSQH